MRLPKKTKPYHLKDVKFGLVISVIAISIIGVMVIGSAKQAVQGRQIIGLVAGVILMIILSMIDYVWLLNFYWILYGINIIALVCVAVWNQCKWCTAVDRYRSDEFSAIRAQQNTGCRILCKISDES